MDFEGRRVNILPERLGGGAGAVRGLRTGKTYVLKTLKLGEESYYDPSEAIGMERDYFTILEGPHKGKKASVKVRQSGSWFRSARAGMPASLVFTMEDVEDEHAYGTLAFQGTKVEAFTSARESVPEGVYDVQIPDAPHSGGGEYEGKCNFPKTWFRIGNSSSTRYIHPGRLSRGCITIPPKYWNQVYEYLIHARTGDQRNVGKVKVAVKPF